MMSRYTSMSLCALAGNPSVLVRRLESMLWLERKPESTIEYMMRNVRLAPSIMMP